MKRIEALEIIAELAADQPIVAMCAASSRELAAVADRPNNLYVLDAMGLTTSIGTGLALAVEDTPVDRTVVIDGDGSLLMNLSALSTAGYLAPKKFLLLLLDNGVYASTAGLDTHAQKIDLGKVGEACGLNVVRADDAASLRSALSEQLDGTGATMLHVRIEPGNAPDTPLLLIDPVVHGARFQTWLTGRMAG